MSPLTALLWLLGTPAQAIPVGVSAGVGLPELVHAQVSLRPMDRLSVDARWGNVVFNHLVGVGATGFFLGQADGAPPEHSLLATGGLRINPTLGRLQIRGGGEVIAAAVCAGSGYAYTADSGFGVQARVGVFVYEDGGLAAGPDLNAGVGWWF